MSKKEIIGLFVAGIIFSIVLALTLLLRLIDTGQAIQITISFVLVLITAIYVKRTADIAEETKKQRYSESLPLLVPTITPVNKGEIPYEAVASGVGMKVIWCNVGKGVAINPLFTFWRLPRQFSFGGAPVSPEEHFSFPLRESVTLEAGSKKEVDYSQIPSDEKLKDISDTFNPRLVAEYQDIYERNIATVQEFHIDNESKRAFVGELCFIINGRRLGKEITSGSRFGFASLFGGEND